MEEEGRVSVWAGMFENEESLMAYAAEDYYDDEDNEILSPFNKDFFDGTIWPFDPDFWERGLIEPTADPKALVFDFSYGGSVGAALKERFPQGLDESYNAVILVYDYRYDGTAYNPSAPVRFLAAVPYEKSDSSSMVW